ncbi:MAG: GxxExxY protein [Betaproteobacteria bacterium]|nr:GxxExxY protein [Betaproteobacteria bacterium]PWB67199.1 MAG: GxxExxY protein [Betaproteobacteria bacterium]
MNADTPPIAAEKTREELDSLTRQVIGAAFRVSSTLGQGFLEKVYENSLVHELRKAGLNVEQQRPVQVRYDGEIVGDYITDILVERAIVLEIKASGGLDRLHYSQCANYLRATGLRICLLLNFGLPRLQLKRIVRNF